MRCRLPSRSRSAAALCANILAPSADLGARSATVAAPRTPGAARRTTLLFCAIAGLLGAEGCARDASPPTTTVKGTITLDGQPLDNGHILFVDMSKQVDSDGGPIRDGRYSFPCSFGKRRVEIRAARETEPQKVASKTEKVVLSEERIPARYNQKSVLEVEVFDQDDLEFPFDLKSQP